MATCRQRGGKWEFIIRCKAVREKPFYFTFDTKQEGEAYCSRLEALLRQGVVPPDLDVTSREFSTISDLIREYVKSPAVKEEDQTLLGVIMGRVGETKLAYVNYEWSEQWIRNMKVVSNLAPSTIRHYVGALARCFDWGNRRGLPELAVNPLRSLPRGYASYSKHDENGLSEGMEVRELTERDRRFEAGEEDAVRRVLAGSKKEGKQRPMKLQYQASLECLFDTALESAMRMREIYTLTLGQIDFERRTIFLEKTKNGDKRQVPMSSVLTSSLRCYLEAVRLQQRGMNGFFVKSADDRLFPWWSGSLDKKELRAVTAKLSQQFSRIFKEAGCEDFHFHDIRHEATSRLFERTTMSEGEIMKVVGHKSVRMLLRYANLRGSNLASKMW